MDIEAICASSFRDFHAKGLDYLCLHRSAAATIKAYFFDGPALESPELVVPHDHRYGFSTYVLEGGVTNRRWLTLGMTVGQPFEEFEYRTPLNGGDGFTWKKTTGLYLGGNQHFKRGATYLSRHREIHTLANVEPGTVLILTQFSDVVDDDKPTRAFVPAGAPSPTIDDVLYAPMDADHALRRIQQLDDLGYPILG